MNNYQKIVFLILLLLPASFYLNAQSNVLSGKYLLVVDMQEFGTKQLLDANVSQNLLNKVNEVIALADSDKVIYVEAIIAKLGISLSRLSVIIENSLFLDDRLLMVNNTRIVKTKPNTFTSKQMKEFIKAHHASDFVIVGLMAEHCIKATALGGLKESFSMSVIPEAIAAESEESKTKIMDELQKAGVKILPLSEL